MSDRPMVRGGSSRRRRRLPFLGGAAVAAAGLLSMMMAVPASAHVRVDGPDATQGGYSVLTFRVPTESETASTVGLSITFPTETPIASVSTQPKAGWTAKVTMAKLATPITTDDGKVTDYVSTVAWRADRASDGIKPGEFDTFAVSAGPLSAVAALSFPALQTYSDGTSVNWNEASANGAEPEHPAPTVALAAAASSSASATPTPSDQGSASSARATAPAVSSTSAAATGSSAWGIGGLVAGVLALIIAIAALARTSRRHPRAREGQRGGAACSSG